MLPKIMPSRLQRVVSDTEFGTEFETFQQLCEAVAETQWAKSFDLNALVIGALMVEHGTLTKVDKPASVELPVEPEPEPVAEKPAKTTTADTEKVVKTYDEGGKGKKQCPACKKYVGLRTAACACGHPFALKTKAKAAEPQEPEDEYEDEDEEVQPTVGSSDPMPQRRHVQQTGRIRIHTPAGACPHRLTGTDVNTVEEWAEHVRKTFLDRDGSWLLVPALKYFAREFIPMFNTSEVVRATGESMTPEYKAVCAALDQIYAGQ